MTDKKKAEEKKVVELAEDTLGESAESKAKRSVDEIRKRLLDNQSKEK